MQRIFPLRGTMRGGVFLLVLFFLVATNLHAAGADPANPSPAPTAEGTIPALCGSGPVRKLSGTVSDQTGAAIGQARLTLRCGASSYTATTDAAGGYQVVLPAGRYQLSIEASSFGEAVEEIAVIDSESGTRHNPVLHVGELRSTVTVSAAAENAYETNISDAATKMDLPLAEVPQSISIINRELMDTQNAVKIDDALKNVAGVIAGGYYDGWDYYRIRGFDASFNTYVDGLRGLNGMMEETWGLESVDVLKGPSSALYGQSTLGGLVNLVTRKPIPANFLHTQVTAGSYNFVDPAIDAGHILNTSQSLYGRLEALYHSGDTFVDYTFRHRYFVAPSITWKPTHSTQITLLGRAQRDNGRMAMPLPAWGMVLPNINGNISIHRYIGELADHANNMGQANQQIGYQFAQTLGKHFALNQNTRLIWMQQRWNRIYYPASFDTTDQRTLYRYPYSYNGPEKVDESDTNLAMRGSFKKTEHEALLGFDFYRSPSSSTGAYGTTNEPLDLFNPVYGANPVQSLTALAPTATVTQYAGIYLQDHIRFEKNVTLTAGGRVDLAKSESRGTANANSRGWTPRLGLTWQALPSSTLYASYSKSFLPQSGLVWVSSTESTSIAPERGVQWEAGVKNNYLGGHATTTIALFNLDRKNVAMTDASHPNYYLVTGEQRSRGVEFESTLRPVAGWNITAAYSYINAEVLHDYSIAAGTPTINAPKNILNVWSDYEFQHGRARGLMVGFGGRHYTDQAGDTANSFQIPGYGLMDATLSYHKGPAKWQFNAFNLADTRYASGSYNNIYVKPGEPRTVRGSFSWNF